MLRQNEVLVLANTIDCALSGVHQKDCLEILPRLHDLAVRYADCINNMGSGVADMAGDHEIVAKEHYVVELTEEITILVARLAELGYVMDTLDPKDFCEAFLAAYRLDKKLPHCA